MDNRVEGKIKRKKEKSVLKELPDDQRKIFELAYLKGLTRREIAKDTGIALGTVNSRARRALIRLGSLLENDLQGAI